MMAQAANAGDSFYPVVYGADLVSLFKNITLLLAADVSLQTQKSHHARRALEANTGPTTK